MKIRSLAFFAAVLLFAGCVGTPKQAVVSSAPLEAKPPVTEVPQFGESPAVVVPESRPAMSGNRAVIALLDRAQQDSAGGRRDAAGASLERALRIEPRNPWLWHELAQIRLSQGQYAQAITLARKSISFAGQDKHLLAQNWKVIGDARVAQGDTVGAEQAFKQAETLEHSGEAPEF